MFCPARLSLFCNPILNRFGSAILPRLIASRRTNTSPARVPTAVWACLAAACICFIASSNALAFKLRSEPPANRLTVKLDLGISSITPFIDPSVRTWNEAAIQALEQWNSIGIGDPRDIKFLAWREYGVTGSPCWGDGTSSVAFRDSDCGLPFGEAIALTYYRSRNGRVVEADVLFNRTLAWNVYSGPLKQAAVGGTLYDLRRVAVHEFGHVVGLSHPDDDGQSVSAIMNKRVSEIEALQHDDITGAHSVQWSAAPTQAIHSAVLPASRSVTIGSQATAFATIVNAGTEYAIDCGIALNSAVPATLTYQTTDPTTNHVNGSVNTPASFGPNASQSFLISVTPTASIPPTDVNLQFDCANSAPASVVVGLNTLLLSASLAEVPDVVALAATPTNDGIVNLPGRSGTGAFAVASANVGAGGAVGVSADTGGLSLPVAITVCQTRPADGTCLQPAAGSVSTTIEKGATPTFAVFIQGRGAAVPFNPATNRIFVRFRDSSGAVRGATSVAVRTQ